MKTNIEKWNYWLNLIVEREMDFIKSQCFRLPKIIYKVFGSGEIMKTEITEITYFHKNYVNLRLGNRMPTKEDINRLIEYHEANIPLLREHIIFKHTGTYNGSVHNLSTFLFDRSTASIKELKTTKKSAIKLSRKNKKKISDRLKFNEIHKKDENYDYRKNGYKDLGWVNMWNSTPDEYKKCIKLNHFTIGVSHGRFRTEHTESCPICKIYWKTDSSD